MKQLLLFSITAFICLNTYGQSTYTGKIIGRGNPCTTIPCLPCVVLWLETSSNTYVLTLDSDWICNDRIIVGNIEYFIDEEVEITGTITTNQDIHSNEYSKLEIEAIKKLISSNSQISLFDNRKVYYDETKQVIVIDETWQNQSLIFELVDVQGKVILQQKVNKLNNVISTNNLLGGVYIYRLFTKNGIWTGKILKY